MREHMRESRRESKRVGKRESQRKVILHTGLEILDKSRKKEELSGHQSSSLRDTQDADRDGLGKNGVKTADRDGEGKRGFRAFKGKSADTSTKEPKHPTEKMNLLKLTNPGQGWACFRQQLIASPESHLFPTDVCSLQRCPGV